MLFWLKKFISIWLMPIAFCIVAIVAGLLLLRFQKRPRLGRALVVGGVILLMLFSNDLFSRLLIGPLERRYPAIPEIAAGSPLPPRLAGCQFVIVLGSGNGHTPGLSANNLLSRSALARVVEAVRLLQLLPAAKLVVSGPGDGRSAPHATVLGRTALQLGIARDRIVYIDTARDTEEEMHAVRRLVGAAPFALVTSAWHMPRSMALFRGAGLDPVPCPTDFTTHTHDPFNVEDVFWDIASLERSTWAVRERIGYLWIWLRGKT